MYESRSSFVARSVCAPQLSNATKSAESNPSAALPRSLRCTETALAGAISICGPERSCHAIWPLHAKAHQPRKAGALGRRYELLTLQRAPEAFAGDLVRFVRHARALVLLGAHVQIH